VVFNHASVWLADHTRQVATDINVIASPNDFYCRRCGIGCSRQHCSLFATQLDLAKESTKKQITLAMVKICFETKVVSTTP
jgi:hypothetical protein